MEALVSFRHKRLFLGQASNYKARDVLRHTFAFGTKKCSDALRYELAKRYTTLESLVHLMSNGRSALAAGLKLTVPAGSEVIINAFTCYAVLQAVEYADCKPVYADIDEKTLSFTVETLKEAIKKHPNAKAIILQNTLGIPMDIKAIESFAKKHDLVIIEDLAHSTGIKYADGREIGSVGAVAALSFGKGKSLDSITGGALVINDRKLKMLKPINARPRLADTLRARWYPVLASIGRCLSRVHLQKYWYGPLIKIHFIERAVDARLDLKRRPAHWQAKMIVKQLKAIPEAGAKPIRVHKFVKNRATLIEKLDKKGYNFREIWYDKPVSPVRYYNKLNFPEKEFPVATEVSEKIINIPTYYKKEELAPALKMIERYESKEMDEEKIKNNKKYEAPNFPQSKAWAKVNAAIGHKVISHKFDDGGYMVMIIKDAKRGRFMEIPCGPVIDWHDAKKVSEAIAKIKETAKENHCGFVRLRPQLLDTPENLEIMKKTGAKLAPWYLAAEHTVIIDLAPSEEQLLANMRRQTRYEVRRADKLGIKVEKSNSEKIFKEFHAIQVETAKRQHFIPPDYKTLLAEKEAFGDKAQIYVAKTAEGKPIAYGLILVDGDEGEYYEAASTELNRKLPGAYALLWRVIRDLKKAGVKRFNLWGIAPPDQPNHKFAGVTTFKKGFGGDVVSYIPAHDLVINRLKYAPDYVIEKIRKKKRHV